MTAFLNAIDLVTQNQLTITARVGINPADRLLGDINPGLAVITVNPSSTVSRQVGALISTEINITSSVVENFNGKTFGTGEPGDFNSLTQSGYTSFNKQVGSDFGALTFTVTNFSSQLFDTPGTYSWTVPAGISSISVAGIGGGGGGAQKVTGGSGGGGGLLNYSNSIPVTPGTTCTIVVGSGGATGGTYGVNGSSTYMLLPGSNIPIVIAQGGAGGDSIYWVSGATGVTYTDGTGIISTQAAYDPVGGTIAYSVSSGSLPTGATLNTSTGVISWVEQNVAADTEYTPFTLSAYNGSQTITKPFTIKILKVVRLTAVEYLVVAGGGGGGYQVGGGGGGGGLLYSASLPVTAGTAYTVTVGASGAGAAASSVPGASGGNSSFSTLTAIGGGGGGSYAANNAATSGGSGGGGGGGSGGAVTGAAGTAGQGYAGGDGVSGSWSGGGGGGAGAVGSAAVATSGGKGGKGGDGLPFSISGVPTYYAGGGGGCSSTGVYNGGTPTIALGGLGGGGNGGESNNVAGTAATANTGGGGGGNRDVGTTGYNGGTGVVIIRYADSYAAAATTGSPTITVAGGYRVYKFTASGTITF
jgi:hypothetical protein